MHRPEPNGLVERRVETADRQGKIKLECRWDTLYVDIECLGKAREIHVTLIAP